MPRGEAVSFSFSVSSVAVQPALTLAANLILTLDPIEEAVQGSAEYYTDLRMNRFFELGDTSVTPPRDNGPQSFSIVYSHIPTGPESAVAYELELCRAERLLTWMISARTPRCTVGRLPFGWTTRTTRSTCRRIAVRLRLGPESRITLPSRQPWVTNAPIELVIDAPNPPNILPGDGWDLTFRLYHPDENSGYTVYEEDVFTYQLAVFADPAIHAPRSVDPEAFYEGKETQYLVTVRNDGTAQALGVRRCWTATATSMCSVSLTWSPHGGQ